MGDLCGIDGMKGSVLLHQGSSAKLQNFVVVTPIYVRSGERFLIYLQKTGLSKKQCFFVLFLFIYSGLVKKQT